MEQGRRKFKPENQRMVGVYPAINNGFFWVYFGKNNDPMMSSVFNERQECINNAKKHFPPGEIFIEVVDDSEWTIKLNSK